MVRIQTGLAIVGVFLLATKLYAEPKLVGAASGASQITEKSTDTGMTTEELQSRVKKLSISLDESLQHAQIAQSRAKKAKDILKLNCVNDGLLVTKTVVNIGESAKAKFDKATVSNDRNEQLAQYDNLVSAAAQCDQAKQGIDACVGTSEVVVTNANGSKVTTISPNVHDNPTSDCNTLGLSGCWGALEYVAYASPFTPN